MRTYRVSHILCCALLLLLVGAITPRSSRADTPFVGEIRWVAFNFAPVGWEFCNGQLLSIAQDSVLFNLIGTTYGGDGQNTFALPDLRGRAPVHVSNVYSLASKAGEEGHILTLAEIPVHTHTLMADPQEGNAGTPAGNSLAKTSGGTSAYGGSATAVMAANSLAAAGVAQPQSHENMKPFLTLNCIIATQGIFPSQN